MNKKISEEKISRNTEIIDSQIDDEVVMMDIEAGLYFGLNNIGSIIWESLEQPKTISELVAKLTQKFDVSAKECEADITPFIETMIKSKLLIKD